MVQSRDSLTGRTWVVVADSSRANIYLRPQRNSPLKEIASFDDPQARLREQDLTSDLPGRASARNGASRDRVDSDFSAKAHERETFARQICGTVEHARSCGEFDELILIAPPRVLGLMREVLSRPTLGRVSREIPKNLVQMPPDRLHPYLTE